MPSDSSDDQTKATPKKRNSSVFRKNPLLKTDLNSDKLFELDGGNSLNSLKETAHAQSKSESLRNTVVPAVAAAVHFIESCSESR